MVMVSYIFALGLFILALLLVLTRTVFLQTSSQELKRRGSRGDKVATSIYQVSRHRRSVDTLLLGLALISASGSIFIVIERLEWFVAIPLVSLLISLLFIVLPGRQTRIGKILAQKSSPYLAKLIGFFRPYTGWLMRIIGPSKPSGELQTIYEKEDLVQLLQAQKISTHNRIEKTELDFALHALTFGEKKVGSYQTPKSAVRFVNAEDPIGPILLSELHDSGFSRFPVYAAADEEKIVGTLYLRDLVEKRASGIVSNVMSPDVFYVHESAPLEQVLHAFLTTKHHIFIVVDEFEEVTGIVTIEDVLEQVIGQKIVDEFDQYDDMREVAKTHARKTHDQNRDKMI